MTDQLNTDLLPVTSLTEYFMNSIDEAMEVNNVDIDEHTAHYVVNLLTLFARSEALYHDADESRHLKPLALMLSHALDAPSEDERNFGLQRMGDISLFVAGFFADSLQRSPVDVDYYINMGGGAYHSLSVHIRGTVKGQAFGSVFMELASKFHSIVDLLNEVRDSAQSISDERILRLYELWLKTGSQRAARLLGDLGVQPVQQPWADCEH
jgi:hypothetical protein